MFGEKIFSQTTLIELVCLILYSICEIYAVMCFVLRYQGKTPTAMNFDQHKKYGHTQFVLQQILLTILFAALIFVGINSELRYQNYFMIMMS